MITNCGQVDRYIAGAFIADRNGRLLLLQRAPDQFLGGFWELPSGHVEPGEKMEDAIRRETLEETGLTVIETGPVIRGFSYISRSGKITEQQTHLVTWQDGPVVLSPEHVAYVWVAPEESLPSPVSEETRGEIEAFFAYTAGHKFQQGAEGPGRWAPLSGQGA